MIEVIDIMSRVTGKNFILDSTGRPRTVELDIPNDDFWFQELHLDRQ